jgi:hypothetical protein
MSKYSKSNLFIFIEDRIKQFPGTKEHPINRSGQPSMVAYYSYSKYSNKKMGLIWIEYLREGSNTFKVHLRKGNKGSDSMYPKELIAGLSDNFKINGWGDYPEFSVSNQKDAEIAIELAKYAYKYF